MHRRHQPPALALGGLDEPEALSVRASEKSITPVKAGVTLEPQHAPALEEAVAWVGDVQVRNRGTIGGNLAHGDPAADLPGAALASNATLVVEGPDGERKVPADEFFFGVEQCPWPSLFYLLQFYYKLAKKKKKQV